MAVLLSLFSFILYNYIRYSVDSELQSSLIKHANYLIEKNGDLGKLLQKQEYLLRRTLKIDARIVVYPSTEHHTRYFEKVSRDGRIYLRGFFPYDPAHKKYLRLEYDVTQPLHMVHEVFRAIVLLNLLAMGLIILYAYILSGMLIAPIEFFSKRLSRMNENILETLDLKSVPAEFQPLAKSINQLVARIKSHLLYKKELFVGTAHELKTPLAVMKTRSQVALIKRQRSREDLERILRENIETIDNMNHMVGAILQFGRAEGAQFETARSIDVIAFLRKKTEEFRILAHAQQKEIFHRFSPEQLELTLQPLLLHQIFQNLVQNALRYTPEKGTLRLSSYLKGDRFIVEIRDEGPGIEEGLDLFAPFKRSKDSPGAGLGLFLVKNAVDTLGGTITLRNRDDGRGAVAILTLPIDLSTA